MQRHWIAVSLIVSALVAAACVTINVYFPEAEVKDLAEQIEDAVAREAAEGDGSAAESAAASRDDGDGTPGAEPDDASLRGPQDVSLVETQDVSFGKTQNVSFGETQNVSWLRESLDMAVGATLYLLSPTPAYAQNNDVAAPEISNPAIRKIIQSRGARVSELDKHKTSGALAESNQALVVVRQLDALPLQQRAAVQKLVKAENADRERMFEEIAAATGTDLSQLPKIRSTYAATLRQNARPGDWIQQPDGTYRQK